MLFANDNAFAIMCFSTILSNNQFFTKVDYMCGSGSCLGTHYNKPDFLSQTLRSSIIIEQSSCVFSACFHLSEKVMAYHLNQNTFEFFHKIHDGSHGVEKILEATSFIKDMIDIYRNDFIKIEEKSKKIDYLRTGVRVAHLVSHILIPIAFLSDLKILTVNSEVKRIFKLGIPIFHLVGFSAYTASLLWKKYMNDIQEKHFYSDLAIQMGSIVFYAVPLTKEIFDLTWTLNKISTIVRHVAGLTSGLLILYRLHKIEVEKKFEYPFLCTKFKKPKRSYNPCKCSKFKMAIQGESKREGKKEF